jgi:hypothetical protein
MGQLILRTSTTEYMDALDALHKDPAAEALTVPWGRSVRLVQAFLADGFELLRTPELLHPGENDAPIDVDLRVDPVVKELFLHIRRPEGGEGGAAHE